MIGFLLTNDRRVKLKAVQIDEGRKLKRKPIYRKNKIESYFDEDGSVMSDDE